MNLRKEIAKAIHQALDPVMVADITSQSIDKPLITSKIRRSLEKAAEQPEIQAKMRDLINTWALAADQHFRS
jgi:hypothetical protein